MSASTDALNNALAGLTVSKARIDTISRNVSNASTDGYSRKEQAQITSDLGTVLAGPVQRSIDDSLIKALREQGGATAKLQVTVDSLSTIESTLGTPNANSSLSAVITKLQSSFQDLAVSPQKTSVYGATISAADDLSASFRSLYGAVEDQRSKASGQITQFVGQVNETLQKIDEVNKKILGADAGGTSDLEDQRDRLLKTLSGLMDVTTFTKPNNQIAVYSRGGEPLVDLTVRTLAPSDIGINQTTPPAAPVILVRSGSLGGLIALRDTTLPKIETQLDDMARALTVEMKGIGIELFNDGGNVPFAVPVNPLQLTGYASRIAVNNTIRNQPSLIRDGSSAVPLASGDTTFIDQAVALFQRTNVAFNAATGLPATGGLAEIATEFVAQRGQDRQSAQDSLTHEKTVQGIFEQKQSGVSGVNTDDEMSQLILFQQAFSANARIITTTQTLFDQLLNSLR